MTRIFSRGTPLILREVDGAAAAEFAMILPLLFAMVFTVYQLGRIYWIQNSLQFAAESAGRCLMAHTSITTVASGTCAVSNWLSGLNTNTPTASTPATCTGALSTLNPLPTCTTVTVTYSMPATDPLNAIVSAFIKLATHNTTPPSWTFSLSGQSTVPIS
jgi:Flp pilus assembly protein TadG